MSVFLHNNIKKNKNKKTHKARIHVNKPLDSISHACVHLLDCVQHRILPPALSSYCAAAWRCPVPPCPPGPWGCSS